MAEFRRQDRVPANDNVNHQIPDDPYTMAVIDQQWASMVREGNKIGSETRAHKV